MPIVLTLKKSLHVLESIVRRSDGIGTRAIAQELGINVATAHNIATTFASLGYVRQDEVTRLFHPGPRLMLLSRHPTYLRSLSMSARPVVHEIATELNESVMLVISDHNKLINLEYVPSKQALRVQEPEDVSGIAHCTAFGKLILAHFDEDSLEAYLAQHGLTKHTPRTITDPVKLREELARIRENEYSHTCDELCEGISALAVPIRDPWGPAFSALGVPNRDPWGSVFAALGASAPTVRLKSKDQIRLTLDGLQRAADEIGKIWAHTKQSTSDAPPGNRRGRPRKNARPADK
ncbi:IclR family transcriptional regulator [Termitidicoccus mucosus]|uniref:IclR family transcriptional regulator n=1 Tax=Termitidicoccus mucosus TaxID=1184151 RepID=A0A178IL43_9BACT|nr:IclR family transcriptional regulator [Opitutaceae bacterium TSB47]